MTNCSSHSDSRARHESVKTLESTSVPGVRFTIRRISFGGRTELLRRLRELVRKGEFLEASEGLSDRTEAALLGREADHLYLKWGLAGVEGMEIDGEPAGVESVIDKGPEALCEEILRAIQSECGLSASEQKN